jgi:hypothetical protein
VIPVQPPDARLAPVDDTAKADARIIANPAPGFKDPIPNADPKIADPFSARATAERDVILDGLVERRFMRDPEVINLTKQMSEALNKLDEAKRLAINPTDPAINRAQNKLDALNPKWRQLWTEKSEKIREELGEARTHDEIEVLQARRDGKFADVRKAEAQRDVARLALTNTESLFKRNGVAKQEVTMFEGKLAVAEAELASKKAALDEADALLNQAKRHLGVATTAKPAPDLVADRFVGYSIVKGSKDKNADRDVVGLDAQDEVAVWQARRDGKAAELQKAEARSSSTRPRPA